MLEVRVFGSIVRTYGSSLRCSGLGQAAYGPLREHAKAFLYAFILREPGAENAEPLCAAVGISEQMDADFVRQKRV